MACMELDVKNLYQHFHTRNFSAMERWQPYVSEFDCIDLVGIFICNYYMWHPDPDELRAKKGIYLHVIPMSFTIIVNSDNCQFCEYWNLESLA